MSTNREAIGERFLQQIDFLIEIDRVKTVFRKTRLFSDNKRYENDAEHGWHMSLMALILSEHSNQQVDISKVVKMALIHDLVEIDTGDIFLYAENQGDKTVNERECAERIFGLLPEDQRDEYMKLWEEFEAKETAEAQFAGALDRLGPVMQNYYDSGHAWKKHNITADKVLKVNQQIKDGSEKIWQFAKSLIDKAVEKGDLEKGTDHF